MDKQMDALLCHFYRAANADEPHPVTVEELEQTYPKISPSVLVSVETKLELAGYIRAVPEGGHVITAKGRDAYLED